MSTIDSTICECTPCRACDGEGEFSAYVAGGYFSARGLQREYQRLTTCSTCHGTGKYADDCEVHSRLPEPAPLGAFDAQYGITAEQLAIPACSDCANGYHDEPARKPCGCACHARRAA